MHAPAVLGYARAVAEAGLASVAGSSIDFCEAVAHVHPSERKAGNCTPKRGILRIAHGRATIRCVLAARSAAISSSGPGMYARTQIQPPRANNAPPGRVDHH